MPQFNKMELSWAAGLFDGEGTIGVRRNGSKTDYRRIGMSIRMTDPDVVQRFHRAVGGLGVFRGDQPQRHYPRSVKTLHGWYADSYTVVQQVVALLWSWLSEPKKKQASDAMKAFQSNKHRSSVGRIRNVFGLQEVGQ